MSSCGTLMFFCGKMGAGKSTLAARIAHERQAVNTCRANASKRSRCGSRLSWQYPKAAGLVPQHLLAPCHSSRALLPSGQ